MPLIQSLIEFKLPEKSMTPYEYQKLDGLALSNEIKSGKVSCEEVMKIAIHLATEYNKKLNFLKYPKFEESLKIASDFKSKSAQSNFYGVPFLYKDSGLPVARFESSVGSEFLGSMSYERNSTFADRVESAGLIPFGRTTVPEMCMGPSTEAKANGGITLNPWDKTLSCGGSSGGAGAAVAAGVVPIAHGSDGGGSIRVPSANCGVVGLKTSRGRFPMGPDDGQVWGDLICDGFLTRSIRDTAAMLDAVQGPDVGAPFSAPSIQGSYLDRLEVPFNSGLKIAMWTRGWEGSDDVDSHTLLALQKTANLLGELGHTVIEQKPVDIDYLAYAEAHTKVLALAISSTVDSVTKKRGFPLRSNELEFAIENGLEYSRGITSLDYANSLGVFRRLGRILGNYMESYDLVLLPTVPFASMPHGRFPRNVDFLNFRKIASAYNCFTSISNASGQPAISIPISSTEGKGMPVAIQLLARYGDEDTLLRVSRALETIAPWASRYRMAQQ